MYISPSIFQVVETEANREALRKELANMQRKFAEFEDEVRVREKDFAMALEDSRRNERKLAEDRHNLEIALDNANADIQVNYAHNTLGNNMVSRKRVQYFL